MMYQLTKYHFMTLKFNVHKWCTFHKDNFVMKTLSGHFISRNWVMYISDHVFTICKIFPPKHVNMTDLIILFKLIYLLLCLLFLSRHKTMGIDGKRGPGRNGSGK